MGPSIKYVPKTFPKTNISNPPDMHTYVRVHIKGLEMLVFGKVLHTYLMDDPYVITHWLLALTLGYPFITS